MTRYEPDAEDEQDLEIQKLEAEYQALVIELQNLESAKKNE